MLGLKPGAAGSGSKYADQLWARSPEEDRSPTKIESSRVGIEIGEALPDLSKNRDRDRGGLDKSGSGSGIGMEI